MTMHIPLALALAFAAPAVASEIGQVKVAKGAVQVEREGASKPVCVAESLVRRYP